MKCEIILMPKDILKVKNFEPDLMLNQNSRVFILFGTVTSGGRILWIIPGSYVIIT